MLPHSLPVTANSSRYAGPFPGYIAPSGGSAITRHAPGRSDPAELLREEAPRWKRSLLGRLLGGRRG